MYTPKSQRSRSSSTSRNRLGLFLICQLPLVCGLIACDDAEIHEEKIAKGIETIPATDRPQTAEATDQSDDGFPWTVPDGWTLDETPRTMRIATYTDQTLYGEQEIAVTRFSGRVGGELANINRWRGQMGLSPIGESELENSIERFATEGYDGYQIRIESDQGVMLAVGVFDESINQTWFVRATLPQAELADRLEDDLFAMARSIAQ